MGPCDPWLEGGVKISNSVLAIAPDTLQSRCPGASLILELRPVG